MFYGLHLGCKSLIVLSFLMCQVDGLDEMHPDAFMDPGFLNGSQDMSGHGRGLGPPGRGRGGPPPPR